MAYPFGNQHLRSQGAGWLSSFGTGSRRSSGKRPQKGWWRRKKSQSKSVLKQSPNRRIYPNNKPIFLEPLEPRLLLSADIAPAAGQGIIDGLEDLSNWFDELEGLSEFSAPLPLVDTTLAEILDVGDFIQTKLIDPLSDLGLAAGGLKSANIATELNALPSITATDMSPDDNDTIVKIGITIDFTKAGSFDLALGDAAEALGLDLDINDLGLEGFLTGSFVIGFNTDPTLSPEEAFFIEFETGVDALSLGVRFAETGLVDNFDLGFVDAQLNDGSLSLTAELDITLPGLSGDGVMTLSELTGTDITGALSVSGNTDLTAMLDFDVTLGTFSESGELIISALTGAQLFSNPTLEVSIDNPTLNDFTNIKAGDVVGMLQGLGSQIEAFAGVLDVANGIPFLDEALGSVADFQSLLGELTDDLFDPAVSALRDFDPSKFDADGTLEITYSIVDAVTDVVAEQTAMVTIPDGATNLDELITAINAAFATSGIGMQFAAVNEDGQLLIKAIDSNVTAFNFTDVSANLAEAVGLETSMFSQAFFEFSTIQELVVLLGASDLTIGGVAAIDVDFDGSAIVFNLNIADDFEDQVLLSFNESLNVGVGELVVSGSGVAALEATAGLTVSAGIDIRTVSGDTKVAELNGGTGVRISPSGSGDISFQFADGTTATVDLSVLEGATTIDGVLDIADGDITLDQLIQEIQNQTAGKVEIDIDPVVGSLIFRDTTVPVGDNEFIALSVGFDGVPISEITDLTLFTLNFSDTAILSVDVNLSGLDENGDGVLDGTDAFGAGLLTNQDIIDEIIVQAGGSAVLAIDFDPVNDTFVFKDLTGGDGQFSIDGLSVASSPASSALVDLGIILFGVGDEDREIKGGSIFDRFFIMEDSSISADATFSFSNIDLTGALGFLEIGIIDGSLSETMLAASISLQDPGGPADGRIYLDEIASRGVEGPVGDQNLMFLAAGTDLALDFTGGVLTLPVTLLNANDFGIDLDSIPSLDLAFNFVDSITGGLTQIDFELDAGFSGPGLSDLFDQFQNMSVGQLLQLVLSIGESIANDFDLLNTNLPLIDASPNDLVAFVTDGIDGFLDGDFAQNLQNMKESFLGDADNAVDGVLARLGEVDAGTFTFTLPNMAPASVASVLTALDGIGTENAGISLADEFYASISRLLEAISVLPDQFNLLTGESPTQLIAAFKSFVLIGKKISEETEVGGALVGVTGVTEFIDEINAFVTEATDLIPSSDTILRIVAEALGFDFPDLQTFLADVSFADIDDIKLLLTDTVDSSIETITSALAGIAGVESAITSLGSAQEAIAKIGELLSDPLDGASLAEDLDLGMGDFVRLFGLASDLVSNTAQALDIILVEIGNLTAADPLDPVIATLQGHFDTLKASVSDLVATEVLALLQTPFGGNVVTFRVDANQNLLLNLFIEADVFELAEASPNFGLDFDLFPEGSADAIPLNFSSMIDGEVEIGGSLALGFGLNLTDGSPQLFLQTGTEAELSIGLQIEGYAELSLFALSASLGDPNGVPSIPDTTLATIVLANNDGGMAGDGPATLSFGLIDGVDIDGDGLVLLSDLVTDDFGFTVDAFLDVDLPIYVGDNQVVAASGDVEFSAANNASLDFASDQSFDITVNGLAPVQVTVAAGTYTDIDALVAAVDTALAAATYTNLGAFNDGNLGQLIDAVVDGDKIKLVAKPGVGPNAPEVSTIEVTANSTLGFDGTETNPTTPIDIGVSVEISDFNASGIVFEMDTLSEAEVDAILGAFTEFNLNNIFAAIESLLQALEAALGSDFIEEIPIVSDAADFITDITGALQSGVDEVKDFIDTLTGDLEIITELETQIQMLLDPVLAPDGVDIRILVGGIALGDLEEVNIEELLKNPDLGVEIDLDFLLGASLDNLEFDLGLDALVFEVEAAGAVNLEFMAQLNVTLGLGVLTGPYLEFRDIEVAAGDPAPENGEDLFGSFFVGLEDGSTIDARLFFLGLQAVAEDVGLTGTIGIDFEAGKGPFDPHEMITDFDDLGFDLYADLEANIDLMITAGVDLDTSPAPDSSPAFIDTSLPTLNVFMDVDWDLSFAEGVLDTSVEDLRPKLMFEDLTLDVGQFLENTLGDLLGQLEPFTSALDPIFDLLAIEIPVISDLAALLGQDPITFGSAIELLGSGFESVQTFLNVLNTVDGVLDIIDSLGETGTINFGNMDFTGINLMDINNAGALQGALENISAVGSSVQEQFETLPGGGAELITQTTKTAGFDTSDGLGLEFDIFNPANLFNILIGERADLVTWDIPRLAAEFGFGATFGPIIPPIPLFAGINVALELFADLSIGLDTRGLETGNFFDGFHFDDLDEAGNDILELGLGIEASASASLNVVVASAGVEGGVRAEIGANWHDNDGDGNVYLDELALNFSQGVACVFDFEGSLSAFFDAFVKIGFDTPFGFVTLFSEVLNLLDIVLLDFSISCPPLPDPIPATVDGNEIRLNIGSHAGDRQPGAADGDESILVIGEFDRNGDGVIAPLIDINDNGVYEESEVLAAEDFNGDNIATADVVGVLGFGIFQVLDASDGVNANTTIVANAGAGEDEIIIDHSILLNTELSGGDGDDLIQGGSGIDNIMGDAGNDDLIGGLGNDIIFGGSGDDAIKGNAGSDQLHGEGGIDTIHGEDGINVNQNDATNPAVQEDELLLIELNNVIAATSDLGAGNNFAVIVPFTEEDYKDEILGGTEADDLRGDFGVDTILGEAGNDKIVGGFGNDILVGGTETDLIEGSQGADRIWGDNQDGSGNGNDILFGEGSGVEEDQGGADTIFGGAGDDTIRDAYSSEESDPDKLPVEEGDDNFYGGDGNDLLVTGVGDDRAFGGDGNDEIQAGNGNNYIEGGSGSDFIVAGDGQDLIIGGSSPFASEFNDNHQDVEDFTPGTTDVDGTLATDYRGLDDSDTIRSGNGDDIVLGDNGGFYAGAMISTQVRSDTLTLTRVTTFSHGVIDVIPANHNPGDEIFGEGGDDIVFGGSFGDRLHGDKFGGTGADIVIGDQGFMTATQIVSRDSSTANSDGDDQLFGRGGNDIMVGGDGNDELQGSNGNDLLAGDFVEIDISGTNGAIQPASGLTVDRIASVSTAQGGNDVINGHLGADIAIGGIGNDTISGGGSGDTDGNILLGDNGEVITGGDIESTAEGDNGVDFIVGGGFQDILIGGGENDDLFGLAEDDVIIGDHGAVDRTSDTVITAVYSVFEMTGGMDDIVGGSGNDLMIGGQDNDNIQGNDGNDIALGDNGRVELENVPGVVMVQGNAAALIRTTDTMETTGGADNITGNDGADILLGGVNGSPDIIDGNAGDDVILGDNGLLDFNTGDNDLTTLDLIQSFLDGLGGGDILSGNGGADVILGGSGGDEIYGDAIVAGTVDAADVILGDNGEIVLSGAGVAGGKIILSSAVATIRTTDTDNNIPAGGIGPTGGIDTIQGNAGNDIIAGGTMGDDIHGNDGDDTILGDNGRLEWNYDFINDGFFPGDDDNNLATLDLITTELPSAQPGGRDTIHGDDGSDIVFGGTDADVIYGDDANFSGSVTNNDVLFGDHGRIYPQHSTLTSIPSENFFAIDRADGDGGEGDQIWGEEGDDIILGQQGDDRLFGGSEDDDIIGGHNVEGGIDELSGAVINNSVGGAGINDIIDAGTGDDVVAADNAKVWRTGSEESPRFRDLDGSLLYQASTNTTLGAADVTDIAQSDPNGATGREITLLDHDDVLDDQTTGAREFGDDYVAGDAGNDVLFGQLGVDVLQGDGSIDLAPDLLLNEPTEQLDTTDGVLPSTSLYFNVFEALSDGDDYIEGNGGADLIYGGLGQDDLIGGSSNLFGLNSPDGSDRPDTGDLIFGGAANPDRLERNAVVGDLDTLVPELDRHARDSDVILGDNGNIYRVVTAPDAGFEEFTYDDGDLADRGDLRIVVRAIDRLDYSPSGPSIGGNDVIHGESGDDFIHGMVGNDIIFGESDDDDIYGEAGFDWISGGTGQDGVLGDDGLLFTSRNGESESLYGVAAIPGNELNQLIRTPGSIQQSIINVAGELKKTADLTPFDVGMDDIIFGGLGSDFLHGGAGDDAISGAEALPASGAQVGGALFETGYDNPSNPGNILGFETFKADEFALYDEFNPLRKIVLDGDGNALEDPTDPIGVQFLLNFEAFTDANDQVGTKIDDGNDVIFGDDGNDWLVGGTGQDRLYGGYGSDLHNVDDNHDTNGGQNDAPDVAEFSGTTDLIDSRGADTAYGGAGRDVLINNTGADRLIDWVGEFNSYIVPFAPFGQFDVSRSLQPQLQGYLYDLSESDGADPTRPGDTNADAARNGEPEGELGLVLQKDQDWQDQTGAPDDPQAGNIPGGKRDVMEAADFNDGTAPLMAIDSGNWAVQGGAYTSDAEIGADAVSVFYISDPLPNYYEVLATVSVDKAKGGVKANGYVIFDYHSATDFKFAGIDVATDKIQIGHRTGSEWFIDAQTNMRLKAGSNYNLLVSVNDTTVTLVVDGQNLVDHTFAPRLIDDIPFGLNTGFLGLGADNSVSRFDNLVVQQLPPDVTFEDMEDFDDSVADLLTEQLGNWSLDGATYTGSDALGLQGAVSTMQLDVDTNSFLGLQSTLSTDNVGGFVFDYYGEDDFKFAALSATTDQVLVGHFTTDSGWVVDASVAYDLDANADYEFKIALQGSTVKVSIDGTVVMGYSFYSLLNDADVGTLAKDGSATFDDLLIQTDDLAYASNPAALVASSLTAEDAEATPIEQQVLDTLLAEAIRQWQSSGMLTDEQNQQTNEIDVVIGELDGLNLAVTEGHLITIDANAAGYGWYLDLTLDDDDSEEADDLAADDMDLLSVLIHEVGHVLGFSHDDSILSGVMSEALAAGSRITLANEEETEDDSLDAEVMVLSSDGTLEGSQSASSAGILAKQVFGGGMIDWARR